MSERKSEVRGKTAEPAAEQRRLIPPEFLRVIAVWSLVPSYLIAGGFLGYLLDRWLRVFPYLTGLGLLLALIFAVRDMIRLQRMI